MRFIDVHCHPYGDEYGDICALMERIREAGVEKIISAGCDLESSLLSLGLAEKYGFCYFTAGFHPTELGKYKEGDLERIAELAAHPKCVAIGEIGLDYHYPETDRELQKKFFAAQLEIAFGAGLPVQIHSRDCAGDMLEILRQNAPLLKNGALMHCFSHSPEIALELEKAGFYFSFGGSSTWRGSKRIKRAAAALRADRILTETDSPYQSPESLKGTFPNTPASIPVILRNLAGLRGEEEEFLAERVWQNAHALFKKLHN